MHPQERSPPGHSLQHPQTFPREKGEFVLGRHPGLSVTPSHHSSGLCRKVRTINPNSLQYPMRDIREWGQPRHPSQTHREPLARFTLQWGRGSQSWAGGNVLPCHFRSSPAFAVYQVAQLVGQNTFLTLILQFNTTINCCSRFIAYSIFPSGPPQAAHPIQKAESIKRKMQSE